jgi:hypothetical protein
MLVPDFVKSVLVANKDAYQVCGTDRAVPNLLGMRSYGMLYCILINSTECELATHMTLLNHIMNRVSSVQ